MRARIFPAWFFPARYLSQLGEKTAFLFTLLSAPGQFDSSLSAGARVDSTPAPLRNCPLLALSPVVVKLTREQLGRRVRLAGAKFALVGSPASVLLDRIELRPADLLDQLSLVRVIDDVRPHELYNLAAMSFVPASWW